MYRIPSTFCVLFAHKAHGQEDDASRAMMLAGHPISIGAKAGSRYSDNLQQPKSVMGASVGGFARWEPLPFMDVQFDLLYEASGGGTDGPKKGL